LLKAKQPVPAPSGRLIRAFARTGRLSATETQSGGQSRLPFGNPWNLALETIKRLVATLLSLLVISPGHAMEIKAMGDQWILSGPVVAGNYDAVESSLSSNRK